LTLCEQQLSSGCDCTHFHITLKLFLWRFLFNAIDLCKCICMKIVFASMNSDFDMKFHDFFNQDDVGILGVIGNENGKSTRAFS